ncbi:MAG: PEP-CTERM sorting domain-containing protein [Candidatus Omnitrophica bacterium]|nr:PEP-CTERM sorting domain-containing protein [Candidatus Omnitrophota bacterium]
MKRFVFGLILCGLFVLPATAMATSGWSDDFNDNLFNSAVWEDGFYGGSTPERLYSVDQNGHFEFVNPSGYENGWSKTYETALSLIRSQSSFGLDNNFSARTDFHFNPLTTKDSDLWMGLAFWPSDLESPAYIFCAGPEVNKGQTTFANYILEGGSGNGYLYPRLGSETDGTIWYDYDASGSGTLTMRITDLSGNTIVDQEGDLVQDTVTDFKVQYPDITDFKILLAAETFGAGFGLEGGTSKAYFDNFNVSVTPEPVSSALFLLGSGLFAARKLRKRKQG